MATVTPQSSDEPKTLHTLILRWLLGQEAIVVVLFLILLGGWRLFDFAMTTAIPAHLKQIQEGYESNAEKLTSAVKDCCSDRKDLIEIIREQRRANMGLPPQNIAEKVQ